MNIYESDIPMISRKNKIAIKVVSKFNILTSNRSFDNIYNFFDTENIQTYKYRGREKKVLFNVKLYSEGLIKLKNIYMVLLYF